MFDTPMTKTKEKLGPCRNLIPIIDRRTIMTNEDGLLLDPKIEFWKSGWDTIWLQPHVVRILILTDDDGSFTKETRFSLTELVDALKSDPHMFVSFQVTTAHRSKGSATNPFPQHANIKGFNFTNPAHFKPDQFDEVWLFGVGGTGPDTGERHPLDSKELRILSQFMDKGGGVFATGDHEDLGIDLCGEVPRVRSMRRWQFSLNGFSYDTLPELPNNAPPVMGPRRHDTLVPGHDTKFAFDDQSDDIPQTIFPKIYTSGNSNIYQASRPHPLLCGPHGVINVLPDHMHEGECEVPDDLSKTYTFDTYKVTEYPSSAEGYRPIPEVIAHGVVMSSHTTELEAKDFFDPKSGRYILDPNTKADTFGTIGIYDGHVAQIGRVVVDSTFHHFFNINLIGSGSNSGDPIKQKGFMASPQGQQHYEQIKAYFRNIAIWIAPPAAQEAMFTRLVWGARWDSQLRMSGAHISRRGNWGDWVIFGGAAREALERLASSCTVFEWLIQAIDPLAILLGDKIYELIHRPDPPPEERFNPELLLVNRQQVLDVALAGIMLSLMRTAPSRDMRLGRSFPERVHKMVHTAKLEGVTSGFGVTIEQSRATLAETEKWLQLLSKRIGKSEQSTN